MYVPHRFKMHDRAEAVEFMRRFSFGLLVTAKDNLPQAIHLPFVIEERDGNIILLSHCARANPYWESIGVGKVLVVFSEPHAYVSPTHYEKELNVPTWNYLSVHAYGTGRILTSDEDAIRILEAMIQNYEAAYKDQWTSLPQDYKMGLVKGIVAFEIEVTELIGKKKLSQNKTENERNNIITAFEKSGDGNEKLIAEFMKRL